MLINQSFSVVISTFFIIIIMENDFSTIKQTAAAASFLLHSRSLEKESRVQIEFIT